MIFWWIWNIIRSVGLSRITGQFFFCLDKIGWKINLHQMKMKWKWDWAFNKWKCKRQSHGENFRGGWGLCPVTRVAMLNRVICIATVHLLLLVIKRQDPVFAFCFPEWKMVKWAQQIISCSCPLAKTKSSAATSAICIVTFTSERIVVWDTLQRSYYPIEIFPAAA